MTATEPELPLPEYKSIIDARPLIVALTRLADAARDRKQAGIDDTAVRYGRLAYDALQWLRADSEGNVEEAAIFLDQIYERKL